MTTTSVTQRPVETGWLPDTPIGDTLLRGFVHNQAEANEVTAVACGGRSDRTDDVLLADAGSPVPYLNQAILARPLAGADDPVLDTVESFFAGTTQPATMLSIWPTPDLAARGWMLLGHPAFVARGPAPATGRRPPPDEVTVRIATSADELATAERLATDAYPLESARGCPAGFAFPPGLLGSELVVRLGVLDGEPVAIGNRFVGHGVVNLCLGATLPVARRRGVWEALVWARVDDAPDLPAVAYTSDYSRPGFVRMGFLPITRFTLWLRIGS